MDTIGKVRLTQRVTQDCSCSRGGNAATCEHHDEAQRDLRRPLCTYCNENEATCTLLAGLSSRNFDLACDECCDHTGGTCTKLPTAAERRRDAARLRDYDEGRGPLGERSRQIAAEIVASHGRHTPGPWSLYDGAAGRPLEIHSDAPGVPPGIAAIGYALSRRDGLVMAAAPKLLAACEALIRGDDLQVAIDIARDALASAAGEYPDRPQDAGVSRGR